MLKIEQVQNLEDERILECRKQIIKNPTKGFVSGSNEIFYYTLVTRESEFIKVLLRSFYTYRLNLQEGFIINFSEIYDLKENDKLTDEDIDFLKSFIEEFKLEEYTYKVYHNIRKIIKIQDSSIKTTDIFSINGKTKKLIIRN